MMKHENILFGIGAVVILIGAAMKIFDLPYAVYGDIIYKFAFVGLFFYLALSNQKLKKRIKQLERKNYPALQQSIPFTSI